MYSYEERIRAVKLYVKLGKRSAATIRELGFPTKNSLATWYREFHRRGDLQVRYVHRKPKYSDEQKKLAVEHYINHGRCFLPPSRHWAIPGGPS